MESELIKYPIASLIVIVIGIWFLKSSLKKYTISITGECIDSIFGYHTNLHYFKYEIDGKEYIGSGRCIGQKRKGKIYNIRVNKNDPEDFVTTGFIYSGFVCGIILLINSLMIMLLFLL